MGSSTSRTVSADLVAHVAQQRQLFVVDELGDALDQLGFGHLIGHLGDDNLIGAAPALLLLPARTQPEAAAAGLIGLENGIARLDDHPAGGKVRAGHELDQLLDLRVRVLDEMQERIAELLDIVRRHARGHADGNSRGAVGKQIREVGRQHRRFLVAAVVGGTEIDGVLVDALEQQCGHMGEPAFGVAHGCGIIAVDVAEIALAVDQRVAHGKILRQPHQRVVNGLITMRVIIAHHLADDLGAFLVAARGIKLELAHGIKDAPMHGFQAVAHVG